MIYRQRLELEAVLPYGVGIEHVSNGNALKLTFNAAHLFNANSNTITEDAKHTLRQIAGILNNNTRSTISITGYTDNTGREDYNRTLSERRAGSVYNYLCEQRVEPTRMEYAGKGKLNPIATNNRAEGRAYNRRVEIVIRFL